MIALLVKSNLFAKPLTNGTVSSRSSAVTKRNGPANAAESGKEDMHAQMLP